MSAETETIVRPCCAMCLIVPDDPAALKNFGNPADRSSHYRNYWLCKDQAACVERANAAQRKARDAVLAAIEAEKQAMEAGDASAEPEGRHAATGLQAVTDTAVAEMTEAAKAGEDAPADGEASDD